MSKDHGGARPGSGRKPDNDKRGSKVGRSISLYADTWEKLEDIGPTISAAIQRIVDEYDVDDSTYRTPVKSVKKTVAPIVSTMKKDNVRRGIATLSKRK
jgi:hypothetical protein